MRNLPASEVPVDRVARCTHRAPQPTLVRGVEEDDDATSLDAPPVSARAAASEPSPPADLVREALQAVERAAPFLGRHTTPTERARARVLFADSAPPVPSSSAGLPLPVLVAIAAAAAYALTARPTRADRRSAPRCGDGLSSRNWADRMLRFM